MQIYNVHKQDDKLWRTTERTLKIVAETKFGSGPAWTDILISSGNLTLVFHYRQAFLYHKYHISDQMNKVFVQQKSLMRKGK